VWHGAASRKVARSIPDVFINLILPAGRTVALRLTQPLTEMSTRNISWGVRTTGALGWQPCHLHVPTVLKSGSLTSWIPMGLARDCFPCAVSVQHIFTVCYYTLHTTHYTLHTTHYTLHTTQYTLHTTHYTLHTTNDTLHTTHYTLHITHYTVHTTHYTLHTTHYTLHMTHYTLHTTHYTLHTTHYTLHTTHYTLHTTHYTLHTTHYTLHITHYTLHTTHYTLHTTHYLLPPSHFSNSLFVSVLPKNYSVCVFKENWISDSICSNLAKSQSPKSLCHFPHPWLQPHHRTNHTDVFSLIILITLSLTSSNNAFPDDGDWTETCRSCFILNFNILLKQLYCASVGK